MSHQQRHNHHQQQHHQISSSPTLLPPALLKAVDQLVDRLNASSGYDILKPNTTPPIYALLIGTNEGVSLSRSFGSSSAVAPSSTLSSTPPAHPSSPSRQNSISEEILSSVETTWSTLPSASPPHIMMAAAASAADGDQQTADDIPVHQQPPHPLLRHLGMGDEVRTATAFYDNCTLIHVHMAPLVVTILTSPNANIGSIKSIAIPLLKALLEPVKSAITSRRAVANAMANENMANMHMNSHHSASSGYYHG